MAQNKSIIVYRMKTDDQVKQAINSIIEQLAKHGRAVTENGTASRVLSRFLREPVKLQYIFFSWNADHKKSIIALPPSIELVRLGNNKIKLNFKKDF